MMIHGMGLIGRRGRGHDLVLDSPAFGRIMMLIVGGRMGVNGCRRRQIRRAFFRGGRAMVIVASRGVV